MARQTITFTSNTTWTVPDKCYLLEVFVVGGGGGGGSGGSSGGGGGGAGGNIVLVRDFAVTPGQNISVSIGGGGNAGAAGGTTSFGSIQAAGGGGGGSNGGRGGSTARSIFGVFSSFSGGNTAGGGAGAGGSTSNKNGASGFTYNNVLYAAGGGGGINPFNQNTPRPILPGTGGKRGGGLGGGEGDAGDPGENSIGSGGGGGAPSGVSTARVTVEEEPNPEAGFIPVDATSGARGGNGRVIISYDDASFDLSTDKPGLFEGDSITVTLNTRRVWNGVSVPFTISGTGITASDFSPPGLTGSFTVSSSDGGDSGSGTAVITTSVDANSESDIQSATISLNNGSATTSFLIGDSSKNALANIESKIISKGDYNTIQRKVAEVLGASTVSDPTYGWGQIVQSSQVSESTKVSVTEWNKLRNDIVNAWIHLYNNTPSLSSAIENSPVRGNIANAPYAQYDSYANVLQANRFGLHPSQTAISTVISDTAWPGVFGASWNNRIFAIVSATWNSAQEARQFFNSGSEIRISSSRAGGSINTQNSVWTSLLSTSGSQAFGGSKPFAGTEPNNGQNFYRLSSSYNVWFEAAASNPYSSNVYRISARTPGVIDNSNGSARSVEFLIEWIDDYSASGGAADQVDGTMTLTVTTAEAIGSLVPSGTGNFTVEAPNITVITPPRP